MTLTCPTNPTLPMPPARGRTASANSQSPVTLEPCWGEEGPCGSTTGPREHRPPAALGEGLGHPPWQPTMPRATPGPRAPCCLRLSHPCRHPVYTLCSACVRLVVFFWLDRRALCGLRGGCFAISFWGCPSSVCVLRLPDPPLQRRGLTIPPFRRFCEFTFPLYTC